MELTTPADRKVDMRKMKVKDEDILINIQLSKQGKTLDVLLDNCVQSDFPLKKMFVGERVYLIIKLRSISQGNIFEAKLNCSNCGSTFKEDIDLEKLTIQKLDKKKFEIDTNNGNYTFWSKPLPGCKKKIKMRLLTGDDEERMVQIRKNYPDEFMSRLMLLRIVEIEGQKMKNINWIKELDVKDSKYLRELYDEHDCGVFTDIEVTCSDCMTTQEVNLPIDKPDFFLPTSKKKII